jgi:hypothetical protein
MLSSWELCLFWRARSRQSAVEIRRIVPATAALPPRNLGIGAERTLHRDSRKSANNSRNMLGHDPVRRCARFHPTFQRREHVELARPTASRTMTDCGIMNRRTKSRVRFPMAEETRS